MSIIQPNQQPSREVFQAAEDLFRAILTQYPGLGPIIMPGFKLTINTSQGVAYELVGGAMPVDPPALKPLNRSRLFGGA